ncbi:MAG: hypothetical protein DCC88_06325 [Spirobacillus cienkowskii]|uniref:Uncharacterized protein n=1 Tax=Spirobacillus cienkowskii TaxID=495820 RepID=A0A369KRG5_9BACT|nr:MAG: hypothetical protein DCC88_06325 [Spirobacillus cienkowskii]
MFLIKNFLKITFIIFLFLGFYRREIYSMDPGIENNNIIPNRVYRTSPSAPKEKFLLGFSRSTNYHTDLGLHITGDPGQFSGFISTTSNRQYAVSFAQAYAMGWWNVREFYLYEIVPQNNFVSVTDTYERALRETDNPIIRQQLENLRHIYTWENEYAALYEIHPETIISATRYEFDMNSRRFVEREEIVNTVTRESRTEPHVIPMLHPDTYSIGTYRNVYYSYNGTSAGFACAEVPSNAHAMKKRNDNLPENNLCPKESLRALEVVENPNYFLPKTQFKFKLSVFNKGKYCLNPASQYYVYIDFCEVAAHWNFTEFGQIITEVDDGHKKQYYCLVAGKLQKDYIKLEICDLNDYKQFWKLVDLDKDNLTIASLDNRYIASSYNYYIYLANNYKSGSVIKIHRSDALMLQNKTKALVQFSVDPLMVENKYVLYPTSKGYMFVDSPSSLNKYVNFYNAHNNSLFSSYGHERNGPQVCYFSSLLKSGGGAWGWINSDYCSNQGSMTHEYRWFFKLNSNNTDYNIFDFAGNILRVDNISGSTNRYFAYTAYFSWADKNKNIEAVTLNFPATHYARTFSLTSTIQVQNKLYRNQMSYNALKEVYSKLYFNLKQKIQTKMLVPKEKQE